MKFVLRLYNRFFASDRELAARLRPLLGYTPANLAVFKLAFSHKSSSTEKSQYSNNERLEYLGDAVLGTIIAEYLFKKYPQISFQEANYQKYGLGATELYFKQNTK